MPSQKQVVTVKLVAGVSSGKSPHVTEQGLLLLENARINREAEIRKRYGSAALTGSHTEQFVTSFQDKPVLIDDTSLKVHNGSTYKTGGFDSLSTVNLLDIGLTRLETANQCNYAHVAESASIRAVVYQEYDPQAATYSYKIVSYSLGSGERAATATVAAGGEGGIRVVYTGTRLLVIYVLATGVVYRRTINEDTGAIAAAVALNSGTAWMHTSYPIDVCALGGADMMITGRADDVSATGDLRVITIEGNDTEHTAVLVMTNCRRTACYKQRTGIGVVCWTEVGSDLSAAGYSNTATLVNATDVVYTIGANELIFSVSGAADSDTTGAIYFTVVDSTAAAGEHSAWVRSNDFECPASGGCTAGSDNLLQMGVMLDSKPSIDGNNAHYMSVISDIAGMTQRTYLILKSNGNLFGRALHGYAHPNGAVSGTWYGRCLSSVCQVSDDLWRVACIHRSSEDTYGCSVLDCNLAVTSLKCRELAHSLLIPAASPQEFDGKDVVEMGFPWYPTGISPAVGAATGLTGDFGYIAVYEWYDAQGRRHQSAPSDSVSVTLADEKCDITLPTLTCSAKSGVRIAVYRTEAAGAYYYRVGDIANDTTAVAVVLTDSMTDADLVAEEMLYSQAEVQDIAAAGHRVSCVHQQRHVYAHREFEDSRIYYSKGFLPNTGVQHNEGLVVVCSPDGGRITALESYQDRLIIFKKDRIYATYGDGYGPNGGDTNYKAPQLISAAVGCSDQKTIVRLPQGLAFMSRDGIYLLDEQLQPKPIGNEVQLWTDQYTYVCSEIVPSQHIAVWMSSTASVPALVYDYLHGVWVTWLNFRATDCATSYDSSLYWKGQSDSTVYVMDLTTFKDAGTTLAALKIRTGWFTFAPSLRISRLQLGGHNLADCDLRLKTFYDLDPVVVDDQTFALDTLGYQFDSDEHEGAGLAAGYTHKAMVLEAGVSRQKCRAMMLEVIDESHDGGATVPVESYSLSTIGFEITQRPGRARKDIGSARRF